MFIHIYTYIHKFLYIYTYILYICISAKSIEALLWQAGVIKLRDASF